MNQSLAVGKTARLSSTILAIQYFLVCTLSFASSLDDARILEQAGEIPAARLRYAEWLEVNKGNREYPEVLFHLASLADSVRGALAVLDSYSNNLPSAQSVIIFSRMAALESLIGLPEEAARHYEMASKIDGNDLFLLNSLKLKFVMGEFLGVRKAALNLVNATRDATIRDEAAAIAALSLAHMGDDAGALAELKRYHSAQKTINSPYFWLVQLDIAQSYGYPPTEAVGALTSDFRNSAIEYIARNRILRWDMPSVLLK
ncbi:hypothetical protein S1OALGB6SA_1615 [Olavius algarvensis spirochete endosymbiont]|uniref:hypothetical protein n=1 Tax=Olavius algarvensis spirochete endosymbiont TaxID=260710 RepID=UPI00052C5698|nr:hypothetical protein [Olavius algarvensis spirochete endosymbiont]KGM42916.1 hypothetical protein JY97_10720 [Alkalispirochaeta odontotermitis]VDB00533.1 hypothetical protein S1OALGB6SA_1615 [Olavius algarvensis spirochete endosymbiont]